ncbi:S-layer homology domain-containing protein [Candidatus Gracilibacteria bacterium]|nr:S-layer homology domain-containing protein [Candidatus Gracilibacteria bacterium]
MFDIYTSRKFITGLVVFAFVSMNSVVFADSFSDVKTSDWYYAYVQDLVAVGVIDGLKPAFDPSANVTREMAAKIVVKAVGYTDAELVVSAIPSFKDVPKYSWAYPYIEMAKSLGIISGYEDSTYGPSRAVSRAEFAAMIIRAFEFEKDLSGNANFVDVKSTDWFYDSVETVYNLSIVEGYDSGLFKPYNYINRAEMSKMIVRAMGIEVYVPDDETDDTTDITPDDNNTVDTPDTPVTPDTPDVPIDDTPDNPPVVDPPVVDPPIVDSTSFSDDFSGYSVANYDDGGTFGSWGVEFAGYGTVGIEAEGSNKLLHLSPKVADSAGSTHASLVTGPLYDGAIQFQSKIFTVQQLRTGSSPNAWEVAWVVWNYTDNDHFYYFIPKPNGWELGKRDPEYAGGQRFLATGSDVLFPIGQWYDVKIEQDASNKITVWVNGSQITSFTDTERPYSSGNIGFYTEDAHIHVDNVNVEF